MAAPTDMSAAFFGNQSADASAKVSRVLAAGGRDKRHGWRAPDSGQDEHGLLARHCRASVRMPGALRRAGGAAVRRSCVGKSGSLPPGHGIPPESAHRLVVHPRV